MGRSDITINKRGDFSPWLLKEGVRSLRFVRASPIAITDAKKARLVVRAAGVGQAGDGFGGDKRTQLISKRGEDSTLSPSERAVSLNMPLSTASATTAETHSSLLLRIDQKWSGSDAQPRLIIRYVLFYSSGRESKSLLLGVT
jgi:hypothetical protein